MVLADVQPDGRSDELACGQLRAAYRAGLDTPPAPLEPGRVYELKLELMAISNVWKQGLCIRVSVQSASYPGTARNPNTNAAPGDDDEWVTAHNRIFHTPAYPSRLLAPVVRR